MANESGSEKLTSRERILRVRPEVTGICQKLPVETLDPELTVVVGQKGYAFGRADRPYSRFLETHSLSSCVGLGVYDPDINWGFVAHLDRRESVKPALKLIEKRLGNNISAILVGGLGDKDDWVAGREIIVDLKDALGTKIVGTDILGFQLRSFGLDTANGKFFRPKQILIIDEPAFEARLKQRLRDDDGDLSNDGYF